MEFFSVTASVYAADAAVKAADVDLIDVRLGTGIGGKSFVVLTGEVAAVREAIECGIHTENAEGMEVSRGDSKPTQRNFRFAFIGGHGRSGG